jgi:hypothetical protein
MNQIAAYCIPILMFSYGILGASTTIDSSNKYGYGANIGWVNAEGDETNGAVIGQTVCSGYIYSANCGWIHLGDGSPANGIAYENNSSSDYGVNHDGLGKLSGYAYGANIGWITFEQVQGLPMVDLMTGDLSGYVWGANVGWISLSGIRTLTIDPGLDSDEDGIPDAWEYGHTNILTVLNSGDADEDGVLDRDEYLADTNPFDSGDYLRITDLQVAGNTNDVTWPVKTTRAYTLLYAAVLSNGMSWADAVAPFIPQAGPDVTESVTSVTNSTRFYRVKAQPPLSP